MKPGQLAAVRGSPCAENPSFRLNDRQEKQEEDSQLRCRPSDRQEVQEEDTQLRWQR